MGFLRRLFKKTDLFDKPCACGRESQVLVAPERESDFGKGDVYCVTCLEPMVRQALSTLRAGCVVVQPYRDAPCLVPYELEELRDLTDWSSRLAELMSSASRRCRKCSAETHGLLWIGTDPEQSLREMQESSPWFDRREVVPYCANCLTSELARTIQERELRIYELVFPTAGPAAWLPWAY